MGSKGQGEEEEEGAQFRVRQIDSPLSYRRPTPRCGNHKFFGAFGVRGYVSYFHQCCNRIVCDILL